MATAQRSKQKQEQVVTLKGSTKMVTEFFEYGVSSILYQRGIYPPDDFKMVKKYGLPMLLTTDESLQTYLTSIMTQIEDWLLSSQLSRLVLAVISKDTLETLERWSFDISHEGTVEGVEKVADIPGQTLINDADPTTKPKKQKTEKEIQADIREIMKQISASVTFLPTLDEPCTFNILAYTSTSSEIPVQWQPSSAHLIDSERVEQVRLRSFSTNVHRLEGMVAYRLGYD